jgi:hypothetical protein
LLIDTASTTAASTPTYRTRGFTNSLIGTHPINDNLKRTTGVERTHSPAHAICHSEHTLEASAVRLAVDPESESAFVQVCCHAYGLAFLDLAGTALSPFHIPTDKDAIAIHVPHILGLMAKAFPGVNERKAAHLPFAKQAKVQLTHSMLALAIRQLQTYPVLARFHHSRSPEIVVRPVHANSRSGLLTCASQGEGRPRFQRTCRLGRAY